LSDWGRNFTGLIPKLHILSSFRGLSGFSEEIDVVMSNVAFSVDSLNRLMSTSNGAGQVSRLVGTHPLCVYIIYITAQVLPIQISAL
jgi:hypothetical protein